MNAAALAVDASVAVKWVVPAEIFSEQARALLRDCLAARQPIVVPPHFAGEVSNAIYQRLRSNDPTKHIERGEAEEALANFLGTPFEVCAPDGLAQRAFAFAADHALPTVYDSLYVTLAHILGVEFVDCRRPIARRAGRRGAVGALHRRLPGVTRRGEPVATSAVPGSNSRRRSSARP